MFTFPLGHFGGLDVSISDRNVSDISNTVSARARWSALADGRVSIYRKNGGGTTYPENWVDPTTFAPESSQYPFQIRATLTAGTNPTTNPGMATWLPFREDTAIRIAASSTDTIIECDSTTGMVAGEVVHIQLDAGSYHSTTIASITDADTFVINDAMPSASAIANYIYFYHNYTWENEDLTGPNPATTSTMDIEIRQGGTGSGVLTSASVTVAADFFV